jgi:hypothetical protein
MGQSCPTQTQGQVTAKNTSYGVFSTFQRPLPLLLLLYISVTMCIFHLGTASFSCHRVLGALCRLFSYSVPIQPLSCLMADEQGCQISKKPPFHFLVYLFQEYKPVTCWPFVHIRPNGSSIRTKLKLSKQVFSLILSCDNPACLPSPRWCVKVTRALGCRLI